MPVKADGSVRTLRQAESFCRTTHHGSHCYPIAIATFAILPAALFPFLGTVSLAVAAAIVVLFFAGMSLSLGLGPYSNVKVALAR